MTSRDEKNDAVAHPAVVKKKDGLHIRLKKRPKKRKLTHSNGPVLNTAVRLRTYRSAPSEEEQPTSFAAGLSTAQQKDEDLFQEVNELQELPCDTALTMKHVIDTQQCMYIPLLQQNNSNALVPAVMNFQLHQKLEGRVVSKELNQLWKQNQKIVRISSLSEDVVVWIATGTYLRAVWDAHRHFSKQKGWSDADSITAWFAGEKTLRTKRIIRSDEIAASWQSAKNRCASPSKRVEPTARLNTATLSNQLGALGRSKQNQLEHTRFSTTLRKPVSSVIDALVTMQLLMPTAKQEDTFVLWLPNFGVVLKELEDAQKRIRMQIVRSMYKESSVASLHQQSTPYNISNKFVVDWMVAQGKLQLLTRPAGDFVQLGEDS